MNKIVYYLITICLIFCLNSCVNDSYQSEVGVFIKELKAGTYNNKNDKGVIVVPQFDATDIPELLKYADDLSLIPTFPTLYNSNGGKLRLGECVLWTIETIRLGFPASMGSHLVYANAPNYEAMFFLSDQELLVAAARYKSWWENRNYPRTIWTIDPCFDEPLCGSGFRWW